jgi:hypothetical protein
MKKSGLKISKMKSGMPNPYMNSKDVSKDINENNHLWYYPTSEGFGSGDAAPSDHPMLSQTKHLDEEGKPMLANDLFRVVHDYFGHAKEGHTFNHDGEENAWMTHKQMYSPLAARAMSAETRGQNSWVNFGPHGERNRRNPAQTKYADQKAGLLPTWAEQPNLPMKKSESDLAKGSLQSRLGNPKKNIASKEYTSMNRWKNSVSGRDTIPEASPEHKQRFFHKLHSQTEVRKHPKTGERLFLMHRGVGELNSRIPHEFNKTSWTPDYSIAQGFATNDDDRDGVKRGKIHSAWIPESAIHNYINNAASKNNTDLMHEQEYIINPHKFIYAKKQKLDPSSMVNENINTRQNLKRVYGKDTAYNGANRADQEIKQFNKKLPRPKKLEAPESIPAPEKLAASETDKVKSFIRHPREVYNDKKKENKRKFIAEGKRKQTGAKKPLDAAIDQIKLDKSEFIDEEELLEKNRPQREGEFHPSQPWTARQHSLGELMWAANDQQAAKIDSFIGNKASHQSLFSKLPQTHRQAYRDMVSQVSKDPDRHFIPSQHGLGGEQKVRARHLKSLLMGDPSVRIDTSNPDRLTIHRQSHTKGTGAANISIHFPTKGPNETTSGNDRPRTSGSVPYGQRIEKSDSRGSRNVMGEDWLGNKQEATIKLDIKKMSQPIPSFPKIKSITTRPDSEIKPVERNNLFLPPKNDKISKLDGSYGIPRRFSQGDIAAKKFQAKMGKQDPNVHEIVRESVDQIARPNGGVTGSVISTKDKKVIMGHYNPKANDDAQMHEAFHFSTKQLGQKLGLNESQIGRISSHLLSHIHPDDYKAFRTIVASRGYDPRRSDFDEEVVAHMGNYLNNKGFRDYSHSVHNNASVANAPESGILKYNLTRNPHETLNPNRFKAGYKKLIRASKDLDEDKIRQITSDINNET